MNTTTSGELLWLRWMRPASAPALARDPDAQQARSGRRAAGAAGGGRSTSAAAAAHRTEVHAGQEGTARVQPRAARCQRADLVVGDLHRRRRSRRAGRCRCVGSKVTVAWRHWAGGMAGLVVVAGSVGADQAFQVRAASLRQNEHNEPQEEYRECSGKAVVLELEWYLLSEAARRVGITGWKCAVVWMKSRNLPRPAWGRRTG
jgi:hypothetical protein